MTENTPTISEIYTADEKTKQFNLTDKFDVFAINKWLSKEGIQIAKEEIQKRFALYNSESTMNSGRFNKLVGMMESFIGNEIAKAKSVLIGASKALEWVTIPENFAEKGQTTPNTPTTVVNASIRWAVSWGFKDMIEKRKAAIDNATK